jgi:hypothetical protein
MELTLPNKQTTPFWHEITHPFMWVTEADLPRLKHNATLPFWKPKFAEWRAELSELDDLKITTPIIDFHLGTNKQALKAAMCWLVDEDAHYGRLIGSYLAKVVQYYRDADEWRAVMGTSGPGYGTGENWGGLTNNHIKDPQMWLSTAHLYDVIYGHGFMSAEDEADFESMMALFYQLSCLHEEMHKMDNNRSVWLSAGGYVSSMFDGNRGMADATRERLRGMMPRFLDTILEDGWHYEIGGYAPGTIAAMQVFARAIRGAEGIDYFKEKVDGVGMEEFYRVLVPSYIPGTSLRSFCYRDRVNHWESLCAGYLEYDIPELGWAMTRMHERPWVPMFLHWPQGFEFYTYKEPVNVHPPLANHTNLRSAGIAILRTSWENDAASMYFRYGFQGSSHGGGLDKLNIELTCNDEPLIADPVLSEQSYDKNVVLVDGVCQEQCSGKILYEDLDETSDVQYVSAVGGGGDWPNRKFLDDPRSEINYWCTNAAECFPNKAQMRRTIVQVSNRVYLVRDTLWSMDDKAHDYQWLWHTFNTPQLGALLGTQEFEYQPKRLFYAAKTEPVQRTAKTYAIEEPALKCVGERAQLNMHWSVFGADLPEQLGLTEASSKYAFSGSPETGDLFRFKDLNRLHFSLKGKDVAMTTLLIPTIAGEQPSVKMLSMNDSSTDLHESRLEIDGVRYVVSGDESTGQWSVSPEA